MIRVALPYHLRALADVGPEVWLELTEPPTQRAVIDALEARFPMLRGTLRDPTSQLRRPLLRFFACERDLTFESLDAPLPDPVVAGCEPFCIVGAVAGG